MLSGSITGSCTIQTRGRPILGPTPCLLPSPHGSPGKAGPRPACLGLALARRWGLWTRRRQPPALFPKPTKSADPVWATGTITGELEIGFGEQQQQPKILHSPHGAVNSFAIWPEKSVLVAGCGDGSFVFFTANGSNIARGGEQNLQKLVDKVDHPLPVSSVAISSHGEVVASAVGYDWSRGADGCPENHSELVCIWIKKIEPSDFGR